jgi:hypothetical protein
MNHFDLNGCGYRCADEAERVAVTSSSKAYQAMERLNRGYTRSDYAPSRRGFSDVIRRLTVAQ